jgi:hypothetical protein
MLPLRRGQRAQRSLSRQVSLFRPFPYLPFYHRLRRSLTNPPCLSVLLSSQPSSLSPPCPSQLPRPSLTTLPPLLPPRPSLTINDPRKLSSSTPSLTTPNARNLDQPTSPPRPLCRQPPPSATEHRLDMDRTTTSTASVDTLFRPRPLPSIRPTFLVGGVNSSIRDEGKGEGDKRIRSFASAREGG